MRRGIAFALVLLAWPAVASGDVLCVPSTSIPGCPATGSANEPMIQDAVNNGHSGDEILIGPDSANGGHPYNESVTDSTTAYNFVGAGVGNTIIQGQGSPAMTVASGSTVTGLTINLYSAPGDTGLSLAGSADDVAVTATGPLSTMNNIGVDLTGGTFSHGAVTLPLTGGDAQFYGGVIGNGTVSDSSITAEVGVTGDSGGAMPIVHRDMITANEGVVDEGTVTIDDSLIKTVGPTGELGIGLDSQLMFGTITARHMTFVGSDSAGSVGVSASSVGAALPAVTTVLLASSIVQGYGTSIDASATSAPFTATTTVNVDHSFYEPSAAKIFDAPPQATAAIDADSASGDHNPLFVNAAAGDYRLQAGSPAIDAGDPAPLAAGESATDLAGNPRAVAGRKGDAAVSDVGAYEFQPHAPTVTARASAGSARTGARITFSAAAADTSPGDSVSYRWSFDDGASASGASVVHAFAKPGRHIATVTATDLDGFSATATQTVAVTLPNPRITGLALEPRSFKHGHATTIRYRDSAVATTKLTIERRKGRRWVKVLALKHHDRAGANRIRLKGKRLKAGAYRVLAVARDAGGASHGATAAFTVRR